MVYQHFFYLFVSIVLFALSTWTWTVLACYISNPATLHPSCSCYDILDSCSPPDLYIFNMVSKTFYVILSLFAKSMVSRESLQVLNTFLSRLIGILLSFKVHWILLYRQNVVHVCRTSHLISAVDQFSLPNLIMCPK